jgi:uncharacterized protein
MRGERVSPRRFRLTLGDECYLRTHWPLLRGLRGALRTEPNVRLAVLFGSTATGGDNQSSDVDVLIALGDPATGRLSELSRRCSDGLGRGLHLVRLAEAEDSPALMLGVLKDGRVPVDREDMWAALKVRTASWRRLARRAEHPSSLAVQSAAPGRSDEQGATEWARRSPAGHRSQ